MTLGYLDLPCCILIIGLQDTISQTIEQGSSRCLLSTDETFQDSAPAIAAMDNVEIEETGYRLENLSKRYFKRIQEEMS